MDNCCKFRCGEKLQVSDKTMGKMLCVAVVVNVVLVLCLVSLSLAAGLLGRNQASNCQSSAEAGNSTSRDAAAVAPRRYCLKMDAEECYEKGYEFKSSRNESLCCVDLGNHLNELMSTNIELLLERDYVTDVRMRKIKDYMAQVRNDASSIQFRPAAHLGILPSADFKNQVKPRVPWERSGNVSFITGGLIHRGDHLVINTSGYYYIYTGLQYNVDPDVIDEPAIIAFIFRNVNGTRQSQRKLMVAQESSCRESRGGQTGPVSLYMAGIYLLRQGDEVSVRTTSAGLLSRKPAATYMGVHMV